MTTPVTDSAAPSAADTLASTPGTPEYDAAMAAAGNNVTIQSVSSDGRNVNQINTAPVDPNAVNTNNVIPDSANNNPADPPADSRPAWLPEKFKSAEDMAKAYSELEKKMSAPPADPNTPPSDPNTPPNVPGVDTQKFFTEFAETGALSEASYAELAKAGLDKAVVDQYINGQKALNDARTNAGYQAVGGEAQFKQMTEWAKSNLSPAEIQAFNSQVSGTQEAALLAIQGLNARYTAAVGNPPSGLLGGNAPANAPNNGFQSRAQVVQAMTDPRYESDIAYRNSVMQKLAATPDSVI